MQKIIELLRNAAGASCVMEQESMKKHTTFRIGGPADIFVSPDTVEKAAEAVRICKEQEVPYYILGNGSNLLVSDQGYRGVVVQIYKNLSAIEVEGMQYALRQAQCLRRSQSVRLQHLSQVWNLLPVFRVHSEEHA